MRDDIANKKLGEMLLNLTYQGGVTGEDMKLFLFICDTKV